MSAFSTNNSYRKVAGGGWEDSVSVYAGEAYDIVVDCKHKGVILVCGRDCEYVSANVYGYTDPEPKSKPSLEIKRGFDFVVVKSTIEVPDPLFPSEIEDILMVVTVPKRRLENLAIYCNKANYLFCDRINTRFLKIFCDDGDVEVRKNVYAKRCQIVDHKKNIRMDGSCWYLEARNLTGNVTIDSKPLTNMKVDIWTESGKIDATFSDAKCSEDVELKTGSQNGTVKMKGALQFGTHVVHGNIQSVNGDVSILLAN